MAQRAAVSETAQLDDTTVPASSSTGASTCAPVRKRGSRGKGKKLDANDRIAQLEAEVACLKEERSATKQPVHPDLKSKVIDSLSVVNAKTSQLEKSMAEMAAKIRKMTKDGNHQQALVEKLKRQRDGARLQALIEKGKLAAYQRAQGVHIEESDDGNEVNSLGNSSPNSASSVEVYEEGREEEDVVEESDPSSCVESDAHTDISLVVLEMQTQIEAIEALLAHQDFIGMATGDTVEHLEGLLSRAREVCAVYAEELDELALARWVGVLQRATTAAVMANLQSIQFGRGDELAEAGEIVGHMIAPERIWKALAFDVRHELFGKNEGRISGSGA